MLDALRQKNVQKMYYKKISGTNNCFPSLKLKPAIIMSKDLIYLYAMNDISHESEDYDNAEKLYDEFKKIKNIINNKLFILHPSINETEMYDLIGKIKILFVVLNRLFCVNSSNLFKVTNINEVIEEINNSDKVLYKSQNLLLLQYLILNIEKIDYRLLTDVFKGGNTKELTFKDVTNAYLQSGVNIKVYLEKSKTLYLNAIKNKQLNFYEIDQFSIDMQIERMFRYTNTMKITVQPLTQYTYNETDKVDLSQKIKQLDFIKDFILDTWKENNFPDIDDDFHKFVTKIHRSFAKIKFVKNNNKYYVSYNDDNDNDFLIYQEVFFEILKNVFNLFTDIYLHQDTHPVKDMNENSRTRISKSLLDNLNIILSTFVSNIKYKYDHDNRSSIMFENDEIIGVEEKTSLSVFNTKLMFDIKISDIKYIMSENKYICDSNPCEITCKISQDEFKHRSTSGGASAAGPASGTDEYIVLTMKNFKTKEITTSFDISSSNVLFLTPEEELSEILPSPIKIETTGSKNEIIKELLNKLILLCNTYNELIKSNITKREVVADIDDQFRDFFDDEIMPEQGEITINPNTFGYNKYIFDKLDFFSKKHGNLIKNIDFYSELEIKKQIHNYNLLNKSVTNVIIQNISNTTTLFPHFTMETMFDVRLYVIIFTNSNFQVNTSETYTTQLEISLNELLFIPKYNKFKILNMRFVPILERDLNKKLLIAKKLYKTLTKILYIINTQFSHNSLDDIRFLHAIEIYFSDKRAKISNYSNTDHELRDRTVFALVNSINNFDFNKLEKSILIEYVKTLNYEKYYFLGLSTLDTQTSNKLKSFNEFTTIDLKEDQKTINGILYDKISTTIAVDAISDDDDYTTVDTNGFDNIYSNIIDSIVKQTKYYSRMHRQIVFEWIVKLSDHISSDAIFKFIEIIQNYEDKAPKSIGPLQVMKTS